MKILINVVHPAHVLYTKYVYLNLKKKGHDVLYAARDREVTLALLDSFHASHLVVSKKSGFVKEAIVMLFGLLKLRFTFRPDFIVSAGGSLAPFISWLTRTKSLLWSDSEHSTIMNLLSHPWSTKSLTSKSYRMGFAFSGFLKD